MMHHARYVASSSSAIASSSRVLLCCSAPSSHRMLSTSASHPARTSPSRPPSFSPAPTSAPQPKASTSTEAPPKVRKPKWTKAQLMDRKYVALGLPPSRPDHERIAKPLKRKQARQAALKKQEEDEMNGRVRRDGSAWLSAQEFEEKLYRDDLKKRQKERRLDEALGTGAIARKRWAWEWFSEGKELKDIGAKMATLVNPPRDKPYHEALMAQWVLTHLAAPPREAPTPQSPSSSSASSSSQPTLRSQHTSSLHLLTPLLWHRLTRAHPSWSGYSYSETVASHLSTSSVASSNLFDLLWAGGWRGEGMLDPEEIQKVKNGIRGKEGRELRAVGAGGKKGLKGMWDKSGEEVPVAGEVLRRFLGTLKPGELELLMEEEEDFEKGWGDVEGGEEEDKKPVSLEADPTKTEIETALERDRARLARHAAKLMLNTTRRGIYGGLGTVVPESARLAQLAEDLAHRQAVESGEVEADEAFKERTKGLPWWGKRLEQRKREKPVEEAIEREVERALEGDLSPWGQRPKGRKAL